VRFNHTTKVLYFLVEVPTKDKVFFIPNPSFIDHKGQGEVTYSICSTSG
jgi:hypothetical protein